jgi:hypothetical protein
VVSFSFGHVTDQKSSKEGPGARFDRAPESMTGSATREFLVKGGQKPLPILGMGLHLAWPLPPPR